MSVADIRGFGRSKGKTAKTSIVDDLVDYIPMVKIEIVCDDSLQKEVIEVIRECPHGIDR